MNPFTFCSRESNTVIIFSVNRLQVASDSAGFAQFVVRNPEVIGTIHNVQSDGKRVPCTQSTQLKTYACLHWRFYEYPFGYSTLMRGRSSGPMTQRWRSGGLKTRRNCIPETCQMACPARYANDACNFSRIAMNYNRLLMSTGH